MENPNNINFVSLFLELHLKDYKEDGIKALIPYNLIFCFLIGSVIPGVLFYLYNVTLPGEMLTVFSGLIAAQGIILAITLTSSQNILSNISAPGFSAFLKKEEILKYYLYFVEYFQIISVLTLLVIMTSTFILACDVPKHIYCLVICTSSGLFFYSTKNSLDICVLIKELIYYRSIFEIKQLDQPENRNNQVVPFSRKQQS